MKTPLLRSAPGVSPHRPPAVQGELLSLENAPQDARFKSKPLCPSPAPVTPACRRSSGLAPVPCPFLGYAMFFTLPADTPKAIAKSLGDPAARLPVAHLPLAEGLRLGGPDWGRLSVHLWVWFSLFPSVGPLAIFAGHKYCWLGPCEGSLPCGSTRLLLTLEV